MTEAVHAGCLAQLTPSGWAGVLITGPSGSGKSDLALRLIERGWALVADDRTSLWVSGGRLFAAPAPPLSGLVEVRGLGVLAHRFRPFAEVRLLAAAVPATTELERVPERERRTVAGVALEAVSVHALQASAVAKLELALRRATGARPAF